MLQGVRPSARLHQQIITHKRRRWDMKLTPKFMRHSIPEFWERPVGQVCNCVSRKCSILPEPQKEMPKNTDTEIRSARRAIAFGIG